jgi:AraC family transcriptional regulator, transcriptional activator FtrA
MPAIVLSVPRHRVVALAPGRVSPLDLGAVAEVFGIDPGLAPDWYEFSVCGDQPGVQPTRGGLQVVVDHGIEALAAADTIVVLPVSRFVSECPAEQVIEALAAAAARGCRIISVCLGAFVLAAAGLLDHRRATTHWRYCAALSAAFPLVQVVPGVLYVDEGDVLTSGGVAAGIDLCLHVVRKDYGAEVTNMLARRLVAGPHRDGGQAQFIEQPVPDTSSQRLGPALTWALQHLADNPTPDRLACIAAMSRRTFYREFRAEMGTTPHHWIVAQQIILARRMLETTRLTIAEIARHAGFEDVSVFRRHFTSQAGLSPNAYRRTFGQLKGEYDHPAPAPPLRGTVVRSDHVR